VDRIPPNSDVISIIGEIDCREGFLVSVDRCRYKNVREAAKTTINIYLQMWKDLIVKKNFRVFVHPALPVLDQTRTVVTLFNRELKKSIHALALPKLLFLDFYDQILEELPPNKEIEFEISGDVLGVTLPEKEVRRQLRPEFSLDGTHSNPSITSLLQESLNAAAS
jgi:hypothetical protein